MIKIVKLQAFDSNYFCKSHFEDDGMQNYLVLQPVYRYFKTVANGNKVTAWTLKGKSDESIESPSMFDNCVNPGKNYIDTGKIQVKFDRSCL